MNSYCATTKSPREELMEEIFAVMDSSQEWLTSVNKENKVALSQWVKENSVILEQINGQRIYGGPPVGWVGDTPPFGTEVFIGTIPQEIYEDKLIPVFETAGQIYEFRLMMTFTGLNRGFAYARYATKRQARLAIYKLNGYEIQPGCKIVVCRSIEKCELLLDGLPCLISEATLARALCAMCMGVDSVSLYASPSMDMKNLAIIKFRSHKEAALAKKTLSEGPEMLCGCSFIVDWLKPQLKQKMQSGALQPAHSFQPEKWSSGGWLDERFASSGVQCLHSVCAQMKAGLPSYQIQFLGMPTFGWLNFQYVVSVPNNSVPFKGYGWLLGENLTPLEQYQKAKEMVALRILKELGFILD